MTVRMRSHPGGVDALVSTPAALALVTDGAKSIADNAAAVAPIGTGHLQRSYKSTPGRRTPTGVVATAYTDDVAGHMAEWGSVNNPAYAPLRRGAARAGFSTRLSGPRP